VGKLVVGPIRRNAIKVKSGGNRKLHRNPFKKQVLKEQVAIRVVGGDKKPSSTKKKRHRAGASKKTGEEIRTDRSPELDRKQGFELNTKRTAETEKNPIDQHQSEIHLEGT